MIDMDDILLRVVHATYNCSGKLQFFETIVGFHSIFFIDRNYGCCLVKHSQEDIRWEPGDPGDDIMLIQLDSGMYQIIKSSQIELMAKRFLNEDWSILGDIYLDHFQNFG